MLNINLGLAFAVSTLFVRLDFPEFISEKLSFAFQDALRVIIPFIFFLSIFKFTSIWKRLHITRLVYTVFAVGNSLLLLHFFTYPYKLHYFGDPGSWEYYARPTLLIYIDATFPLAKLLILVGVIMLCGLTIHRSLIGQSRGNHK